MKRCSFAVWDFQLRLSRWMDNIQLRIFNLQVDFLGGNAGHGTK